MYCVLYKELKRIWYKIDESIYARKKKRCGEMSCVDENLHDGFAISRGLVPG